MPAARALPSRGEGVPLRAAAIQEPLGVPTITAIPEARRARMPPAERAADAAEIRRFILRLVEFTGDSLPR